MGRIKTYIPKSYVSRLKRIIDVRIIRDTLETIDTLIANDSIKKNKDIRKQLLLKRVYLNIRLKQLVDEKHSVMRDIVERLKEDE